ncbi:hypothetical protein [Bacillus paralicheniformis]|uniref:hypothetical protein n=1 Tax=Bacillus paralicheniformis TaxID=1648923 RepID=UPI002DB86164|nr:hypothetical protein [Bacillus paralicheniformis]MEC1297091.1 hypothetical protein [Bacillus paralicheniformis]
MAMRSAYRRKKPGANSNGQEKTADDRSGARKNRAGSKRKAPPWSGTRERKLQG